MRALIATLLLLTGCATPHVPTTDSGAIAGSWRNPRTGLMLSISTFSSFAVQRGCVASGGMLAPLGGGRYRISRYEAGFATEGCGPWRSGPEIAPFDQSEVTLVREGAALVASGGGRRVVLRWVNKPIV